LVSGEGECGAPVLELTAHAKVLTGMPRRVAEVAVVEDQHGRARGHEHLGWGGQSFVPREPKPVRHHDARGAVVAPLGAAPPACTRPIA
jgi:hypothetical protein